MSQSKIKDISTLGAPLASLLERQLATWPDHKRFLEKSFDARSPALMQTTRTIASMLELMIGPHLEEHTSSYKWFCLQVQEEVLNFFRTDRYRFSTFAEVAESVYNRPSYMKPYMQGLLLSQVFWLNHTQVMHCYLEEFLAQLDGATLLEIGPGHGLLSALAAKHANVSSLEAWDISATSLAMTESNLNKLGVNKSVALKLQDVTSTDIDTNCEFDAVVLAEVLEHVEAPNKVLKSVARVMAPEAKLFINVPVNSPALDHIYLLRSPEEVRDLIELCDLDVLELFTFPATGYTEEQARSRKFTLSCVAICARKKGDREDD